MRIERTRAEHPIRFARDRDTVTGRGKLRSSLAIRRRTARARRGTGRKSSAPTESSRARASSPFTSATDGRSARARPTCWCCRGPPRRSAACWPRSQRRGVPFVPRGAGTGLSGGCLPLEAPVMICTSRMNRIVACDLANRRVVVESGVVNLNVTNAVKAPAISTRPILPRKPPALSGAISRRTPAARIR